MKGVVFTEFTEMVEQSFGLDMVDDLIEETSPASGGVYTATGTYPHQELVAMVVKLSEKSGTPIPDLLVAFGKYLIPRFQSSFPSFFDHPNLFKFLDSVHTYIHVEVKKLYPDAEVPDVLCEQLDERRANVLYRSSRHFEDLGRGLIEGAAEHFQTPISITQKRIADHEVMFEVTLTDP